MSSLVSEFIINPVARTVRRLSSPFATGASPDHVRPFSHDLTVANGDAITESNEASAPFASLRRFARSPDVTLGATSPPLLIPQRRAVTAPIHDDFSRPTTVPSPASLRLEMDRRQFSEISPPVAEQAAAELQPAQKSRRLPADDGMREMRRRILSIQSSHLTFNQKRHLMQQLLTENYTNVRRAKAVAGGKVLAPALAPAPLIETPSASTSREFGLGASALETLRSWTGLPDKLQQVYASEQDRLPTYVPAATGLEDNQDVEEAEDSDPSRLSLGCMHYKRNVKLKCATCEKWYTCRLCHDAEEDHTLPRALTRHMLCMLCGQAQKASDTCVNCGTSAAQYYCNICKLWSDDVNKPIYHCDDCGICRVGHGLDKDFFHCKTCRACISITQTNDHKCIERATDADCPICGENMFASPKPVIFMECGHSIHRICFNQYIASSYKCPICSKSIVNMEALFTNLANIIREQPMPEEYQDVKSTILCNDCSAKCTTLFHFLGLRCQICRSFNTVELERSEMPGGRAEEDQSAALAAGIHPYAELARDLALSGEEEDLDFWGGETRSGPESENKTDSEEDSGSEADCSPNEDEEDDDIDEDEDIILLGHR